MTVLLLVLGALIIGGGAYAIGKHSADIKAKTTIDLQPITQNDIRTSPQPSDNPETPAPADTGKGCTSSSAPSITVLSPNGGEVYQSGQQITVKWKSCNGTENQVMIVLRSSQGGAREITTVPDTGSASIALPTTFGDGTPLVSGKFFKISLQLGGSAMAHPAPTDDSNSTFTINIPSHTISTTLPQHVGSHANCDSIYQTNGVCWPPVVIASSSAYKCNPFHNQGGGGADVAERVINGRTYCISSFGDSYAGGVGWTYTYTLASGTGTKTTTFGITYSSCGVIGGRPTDPGYIQCKSAQDTFAANLDNLIDNLMR